jgi:hypothetical protein
MSTATIFPGSLVVKDPSDVKTYVFDWDTNNLALGATITSSTFTITAVRPLGDTALTADQASVLTGNRKTQVRLSAGTVAALYEVANRVVTSESPPQTKERSFRILIQNR